MRNWVNPNTGHEQILAAAINTDAAGARLIAFALAALVERLEAIVAVLERQEKRDQLGKRQDF